MKLSEFLMCSEKLITLKRKDVKIGERCLFYDAASKAIITIMISNFYEYSKPLLIVVQEEKGNTYKWTGLENLFYLNETQ